MFRRSKTTKGRNKHPAKRAAQPAESYHKEPTTPTKGSACSSDSGRNANRAKPRYFALQINEATGLRVQAQENAHARQKRVLAKLSSNAQNKLRSKAQRNF